MKLARPVLGTTGSGLSFTGSLGTVASLGAAVIVGATGEMGPAGLDARGVSCRSGL